MTARAFLFTGLLLLAAAACGDDAAAPSPGALSFLPESVELDTTRTILLTLRNTGERTVGPVSFEADAPLDGEGTPIAGATLVVEPATVTSLAPGASVGVNVTLTMPAEAPPGSYTVALRANAGDAAAPATLRLRVAAPPTGGGQVRITVAAAGARQGDVVRLAVEATDAAGAVIENPAVTWSVLPANAGLVTADGRFVGYEPGPVRVVAALDQDADTVSLQVAPRALSGALSVVGRGPVPTRFTSDLWVHGAHAYTGTWGTRAVGGTTRPGNTLYAWSIANPASPVITDSVVVDARTVNDVKVSADGRLGVLTHEGAADGRGGITLLDLADPAHPAVLTRFTQGLESGVHNVWIEDGYVYVVVNGFGLRIVDIADPLQPRVVASYSTQHLHDVYVRAGLAFLSDFQAGLIVLDVGDGRAGGSPAAPVTVASVEALGGQTHNAWYWPSAGYVFVGEEDYGTPGVMHVVDARDLTAAHEVATFGVPGDAPHNFWLDEERAVLYMAWYSNGLRALDVSGELLGDLGRQGRELASLRYATGGACPGGAEATCTWAPQLHQGLVWVSDMNNGLLSIQPSF